MDSRKEMLGWMLSRGWRILREGSKHTLLAYDQSGATFAIQRHGVRDTGRKRENSKAAIRRLEQQIEQQRPVAPIGNDSPIRPIGRRGEAPRQHFDHPAISQDVPLPPTVAERVSMALASLCPGDIFSVGTLTELVETACPSSVGRVVGNLVFKGEIQLVAPPRRGINGHPAVYRIPEDSAEPTHLFLARCGRRSMLIRATTMRAAREIAEATAKGCAVVVCALPEDGPIGLIADYE